MSVYATIFFALAMVGLLLKNKQSANLPLWIASCFLIVFMGTRYETGCDFDAYEARFLTLYNNATWSDFLDQEERFFHWLNLGLNQLGLDFVWMHMACAVIFVYCFARFAKESPKPMLFLALCFPILVVQLGMSGVRQAVAVSIMLLGLIAFMDGKKLLTAFWILVAAQFHESAYIFLPLALMVGRKVGTLRLVLALIVLSPVAAYLVGSRLEVYSNRYIEQIYGENSAGGAVFRYAMVLIPSLFFYYHKDKMRLFFPRSFDLMWVFSLIIFGLGFIGLVSTVALHRLTYYVMPVGFFIMINVVMALPIKNRLSNKWVFAPPLALGTYLVTWFSTSRHAAICYIPYDSYLF
jgi:hypothetical protein